MLIDQWLIQTSSEKLLPVACGNKSRGPQSNITHENLGTHNSICDVPLNCSLTD